jgi:hypothetical protein
VEEKYKTILESNLRNLKNKDRLNKLRAIKNDEK